MCYIEDSVLLLSYPDDTVVFLPAGSVRVIYCVHEVSSQSVGSTCTRLRIVLLKTTRIDRERVSITIRVKYMKGE